MKDFNITTLNGFVHALNGHQSIGDGMAQMRFVTPDGAVYTVCQKPGFSPVVQQQTGCPSLVRVDLVEAAVREGQAEFLRWQDGEVTDASWCRERIAELEASDADA